MLDGIEDSDRREMARWCFPIISDLVRERYLAENSGLHGEVGNVCFAHSQLWQARILDQSAAIRAARDEMNVTFQTLGLPQHLVEDIDEEILDELMVISIQRFHRSPHRATICGHILLHIAKYLAYRPEALAAV